MYVSDWVKKHYPNTVDADVVCTWFATWVNGDSASYVFNQFIIKGREQGLLELAHQLEKEEKERQKKG